MKHYVGKISSIKDSIIYCSNSASTSFIGELLSFYRNDESYISNDLLCEGCVFEASTFELKILLIKGEQQKLHIGDEIYGFSETVRIKVGFGLLGKTINPFGTVIGNESKDFSEKFFDSFFYTEYRHLVSRSPSIIDRKKVSKPLLLGINSVDCLIPVGLGQRQLIIGDNNTGKTSLAVTAILNQNQFNKHSKVRYNRFYKYTYFKPCIYISIGQKRSEVIRIQKVLSSYDSDWYTCIIFTSADDLPIIQYYAPYTGCAIGEWFMDNGYDCVLVFDDLSKHSVAYRQITLLLRRPPGREAFPGDVFFLHSRLLERSAQLSSNNGEGSLTSLPIIETLCGDVSSYIPTNVISITDGQIFLSKELLNRGVIPAVDLNLSVSRVGSSSQYNFMVSISKKIKMQLSLYRQFKDAELLGGGMNEHVKIYVNRGKRLTLFFTQSLYNTQSYVKQIIYYYCLGEGFVDDIDIRLTNFFLASIFNFSFYSYFTPNNSMIYLDLLRDLNLTEENLSILEYDVIGSELFKLLYVFTAFFQSNILPIIKNFKNQKYIWSLISNYKDIF